MRSSVRLAGLEITGIIDEDYRGLIGLIVRNTNTHTIDIRAEGIAIAQIVIVPNIQVTFKEVKFLKQTLRKGGFGSTDKKKINSCSAGENRVELQIQMKNLTIEALVDSGADGNFIGENESKRLNSQRRN